MPFLDMFKKKTNPKKIKPKIKKKIVKLKKKPKKIKAKVKRIIHKKKLIKKKIAVKPVIKEKAKIKKAEIINIPDKKAYELIKEAKIPVVKYFFCKKEKDIPFILKKIGSPCVMKVSGKKIANKTAVGGVIKNISSQESATGAFNQLMKIKDAEEVLIQKQLTGLELIIGAKSDVHFGHIISLGIGGIYAEVIRDVVFRVCPIGEMDAEEMVRELKAYDILASKQIKFEELFNLLVKLSKLAVNKKIKEMNINPLICDEIGCWVVDVRIVK